MRTLISGERTTLAAQSVKFVTKVEVENIDGTWVDVTTRFVSADITTDVDQPVWSAVIAFQRDDVANTASLSPLRGDSTLNVDDSAAYAPLLTAGREIKVSVATVAPATTPVSGDYRLLFHGRIDTPRFGTTPMTVECRDLGGLLIDTIISEQVDYGDADEPVAVAAVMQQILDDTLGENAPTLVDDLGSDFVVTSYKPRNIPLMEAMGSLATKAGGAVARYRFQADGSTAFTLYDPVRGKTVADATIPPTEYLEVPDASIDKTTVRNKIGAGVIDPVTGELIELEPVEDLDSQAAFGVLYMHLGADLFEGLTPNEALAVIEAALADLRYPKFDHVVGCLLWWPAEVGDLYTFPANDVHYDDDQSLAVMGISHHLESGHGTTRFTCRGTPAGAYLEWIRRAGLGPTGPDVPPAPELMFIVSEGPQFGMTAENADGAVWVGYRTEWAKVDEIRIHVLQGDGPNMPVPNKDGTTLAPVLRKPEGTIADSVTTYESVALLSTHDQFWKRILMEGVRGGLTSKPVIPPAIQAVDPSPMPVEGTLTLAIDRTDDTITVTATPVTLEPTLGRNMMCIVINKHILPPIDIGVSTDPVVREIPGLDPEKIKDYEVDAFILNLGPTWGVSGPRRRVIAAGPTIVAPEFAGGTPLLANVAGQARVEISWTCATPGATVVQVQASIDRQTIRVVGSGAVASGTVYDTVTTNKLYRLVARNILGVALAYSPWKWQSGLPPTITLPGASPEFVNGTPKVVISSSFPNLAFALSVQWRCATPGTKAIAVMRATAGSGGPYTEIGKSASVSAGEYRSPNNSAMLTTAAWFKLEARDASDVTIATSAIVHYVPTT